MGHIHNPDKEYRLLQQRLDRNVTGAPDSPHFMEILKILFSPEDANIARQIPTRFITVGRLAKKLGMEPAALDGWITEMAHRGLVIDIGRGGRRYVVACARRHRFLRVHLHARRRQAPPEGAGKALRCLHARR